MIQTDINTALSRDFDKIRRHLIEDLGCSPRSVSELSAADAAGQAALVVEALRGAGGSLGSLLLLDSLGIEEASEDTKSAIVLDAAMALLEWNHVVAYDCGEWRLLDDGEETP